MPPVRETRGGHGRNTHCFERAVARDPHFALAYDALADVARELNPASPLVRVRYAMGPLLTECWLEEVIDEVEAAPESDRSLSPFV